MDKEKRRLRLIKRRYRQEKLFRFLAMFAIILATSFLVFFLADITRTGYSAFQQTEIQVDVTYNAETSKFTHLAVPKDYQRLISRGFLRLIPLEIKANPELMNTTVKRWIIATAEVDQYMKDKVNRLKPDQKAFVESLKANGDVRMSFNTGFFTNGDSKLPEIAGIFSAVIGSVYVLLLTMLFSVPVGVMTAIYLEEFAPDNWFTRTIEVNINNLAAIPSIIFGLLGLAIFINFFGVPRSSALAGGLTLALMTLPVIIISTRAALRSVPDNIRQGAQGVGASGWQVVWHHVLPLSLPGILTGSIIGLAQAMGETAPLLIIGMLAYIPEAPGGITEAATVLPAQIYTWSGTSLRAYTERTALGIMVLLSVLLVLNACAVWIRNRFERKW
ncbi:phosphate ABC transporter, inner membrane subunit PstA [Denitrovibrio acetiphilus DSM 12809]|uniref:Phosphate transport system permease protein PstA n=1 Tax=Denitrovibrio acetiphilus (strain DSM 12809 / NBRC 114555 / N2460) TaxID=522772 RepID=D4H8P7_DENA2|nr:phosphate ABC transporter permease PstA [Denitrovibrio acetiphilus]ADD68396.1 phosphate ABC transporter, inner membrane subunit PstA [Denitrovibrio acetiphilus DSM 12809]